MTESYKDREKQYCEDNESKIQSMKENLDTIEKMISCNREERLSILAGLQTADQNPEETLPGLQMQIPTITLPSRSFPSEEDKDAPIDGPLNSFEENALRAALYRNIKERAVFQSFARELEESIHAYQHLVNTQATADDTGFRELRDWAQNMLATYEFLATLLISISTVGAGLVYATIFSASRGNIEFMCLTFPLFTAGFMVPMTIQVHLKLASKLPYPVRFGSQKIWSRIIGLFMAFAVTAVLTALVILNLTVFFLDPSETAPVALDSHRISVTGIAVFVCSSVVFLTALVAYALFFCVIRRASVVRRAREAYFVDPATALERFRHV